MYPPKNSPWRPPPPRTDPPPTFPLSVCCCCRVAGKSLSKKKKKHARTSRNGGGEGVPPDEQEGLIRQPGQCYACSVPSTLFRGLQGKTNPSVPLVFACITHLIDSSRDNYSHTDQGILTMNSRAEECGTGCMWTTGATMTDRRKTRPLLSMFFLSFHDENLGSRIHAR